MKSVFLLQHLHVISPDNEDVKLIDAFTSMSEVLNAVNALSDKPGFRDHNTIIEHGEVGSGVYVSEYLIDKIHWEE